MNIKIPFAIVCSGLLIFSIAGAAEDASVKSSSAADLAGSYQIRNVKFGDLLRPKDANSAEGARIVLYPEQPWKCMTWKLKAVGESVFQVQNHFTSKTFVVKPGSDAKAVVQTAWSREAKERPAWRFTKLADGVYEISDPKSGEALTAVEKSGSLRIVAVPWQDKPEQKWKMESIDPSQLTM